MWIFFSKKELKVEIKNGMVYNCNARGNDFLFAFLCEQTDGGNSKMCEVASVIKDGDNTYLKRTKVK
jgi:Na+/H+-translocating membrane pyrophosphatase